jgi:hypothetical protein
MSMSPPQSGRMMRHSASVAPAAGAADAQALTTRWTIILLAGMPYSWRCHGDLVDGGRLDVAEDRSVG